MTARELVIDGIRYAPSGAQGEIKIAVLPRGFVYVGRITDLADQRELLIRGARNIIKWGTSRHIAELANGPLTDTKLGNAATVRVLLPQDIHIIEVNQDAWKQHID